MLGPLCLIAVQAASIAPQFANPVSHPGMQSIVVERVALNTRPGRRKNVVRTPGVAELEPQPASQNAFGSFIVEPDIEPILPPPKSVRQDSVAPDAGAAREKIPPASRKNVGAKPPRLFEIRDPAHVSWLDRFSLEEVRFESSHTEFHPGPKEALPKELIQESPFRESPMDLDSAPESVPTEGQPVVRPPLVPNTPYRPYRFPDSPEQYRASVSQGDGGEACTKCGHSLNGSSDRCMNTKCGCGR